MEANTDLKLTVEAWAEIVIKIWESKIIKKRIHKSGELLNSLASHVYLNSGGDPERIVFAFNYYGRFADMGVGRGVSYDELKTKQIGKETRRRKKSWFAGTFDFHVDKLTAILEEKYGLKIARSIVDTLDE